MKALALISLLSATIVVGPQAVQVSPAKTQEENHPFVGTRLAFRTVKSMILVDGEVNGNKATFLLDTGCQHTVVSVRTYGQVQSHLHQALVGGAGIVGETVRLPVSLKLPSRIWVGQVVSVMDLDDLQYALG